MLSDLFSPDFGIGMIVGFLLNRVSVLVKTAWLNRYRPLPGGERRAFDISVDARRFTAVVMIVTVSWSIFKTQENTDRAAKITDEARAFSVETRECQAVLIASIIDNRKVTAEYNAQSAFQRDALVRWLQTLLDPPPEIENLPADDPVRERWTATLTGAYVRAVQQSKDAQAAVDATRPQYPDPNCPRKG